MRAIVYHAYCRPEYVKMGIVSAESAKRYMPDIETVLLTEMAVNKGFDRVIKVDPVPPVLVNFAPLLKLPADYDSVVYFDCDSHICAPFYDVFELIESGRVDMALVPIRHRDPRRGSYVYPSEGVPELYPEFRGTPTAYQNNAEVREFFAEWSRLFQEHRRKYHRKSPWAAKPFPRQFSMRIALYHSDLTIVALPAKYYMVSSLIVHGKVRAFHTPRGMNGRELGKMAKAVNRQPGELRLVSEGREHLFKDLFKR